METGDFNSYLQAQSDAANAKVRYYKQEYEKIIGENFEINVSSKEKCGKVIAEPKELIRIVRK